MGTPSASAAIPANRSTSLPPGSTERAHAGRRNDRRHRSRDGCRSPSSCGHRHHRGAARDRPRTMVLSLASGRRRPAPERAHATELPRHQHPQPLDRRARPGLRVRPVGHLSSVAGTRCAGPQGREGHAILFYKDLPQSRDADAEGPRFVARASSVFNAAQVEGAPDEAAPHNLVTESPLTSDLDDFAAQTGALIREGETACYRPSLDEIQMPARHRFTSADGYGATLSHEARPLDGTSEAASTGSSPRASARAPMRPRNSSPNSAPPLSWHGSGWRRLRIPTTPATSPIGCRCSGPTHGPSSPPPRTPRAPPLTSRGFSRSPRCRP